MAASKDPRLRSLSGSSLPNLTVESPPTRYSPPNYGPIAFKHSSSLASAPVFSSPSAASAAPTAPSAFAAPTTPIIPVAPVPAPSSSQSRTSSTHFRTPTVGLRHPLPPNPLRNGIADSASRSSSVFDKSSPQHRPSASSSASSSPTSVNTGSPSESSIDSIRRAVLQSRQPDKLSSHQRSSSRSRASQETARSHSAPSSPAALSVQPSTDQRPRLDRKESDSKPSSSSSSSSSRTQLERRDKDKGHSGSNGGSKPPQESSIPPSTSNSSSTRGPELTPMLATRYRNPFEKSKQAATQQEQQPSAAVAVVAAKLPHQGSQRPSSSSPRAHQWPSPTQETLHPKSSPPKSVEHSSRQNSSTPRSDPARTLHSSHSETASPRTGSSSKRTPDTRMESPTTGWSRRRPTSPNREPRAWDLRRGPDPRPAAPHSDPSAPTPSRGQELSRGPDGRHTRPYNDPSAPTPSRGPDFRLAAPYSDSSARTPSRGPYHRTTTLNRDPPARAPSRGREEPRSPARERDFRPAEEQERGRSVTRGRSLARAPSPGRDWTRRDSYRPTERAQSRSGHQSRAGSPARSQSKATSPVRGRSKSLARNLIHARSRSRPVRRTMTMGNFVPRSPSRKRRHYSTDDSDFDDNSDSFTDRSTRKRRRPSSSKRRHSPEDSDSALETSEESDASTLTSDVPLSKRRKQPSATSSHMDASMRLQGPIADRMLELDRLTTKLTVRQNKVKITYRKMMKTQAKLKAEILALQSSFSSSAKTSKSNSLTPIHNAAFASQVLNGSSSTDSDNAVVPAPTYCPIERIETGVKLYCADVCSRNVSSTKGYQRVFDVSGPSVPVSSQAELSALVIGDNNLFSSSLGGLRPRMMVLNPFSHKTAFDGIAAVAAMDGSIQFWDLNAQKLLSSQLPVQHRVIPYPETIAWIGENALVAVSHLQGAASWPKSPVSSEFTVPTRNSRPETQTSLLTISWGDDDELKVRCVGIISTPHSSCIHAVTAARLDDKTASFITGGKDKGLYHWKFTVEEGVDDQANYNPQGLSELHREHKGQILSLMYSHRNRILYSGGRDGHYISCDLTTGQALVKSRFTQAKGEVIHILENPADPNINLVVQSEDAAQYLLCDHRVKNQVVQTMSYPLQDKISKLNIPAWHSDGGLFCTGTKDVGGILNIWDVRWSSIVRGNRPDGYREAKEPYLLNPYNEYLNSTVKRYPGLPTQSVSLGGAKLVQALFHPTRDVMITLNSDSSLAFWDYSLKQHRFTM